MTDFNKLLDEVRACSRRSEELRVIHWNLHEKTVDARSALDRAINAEEDAKKALMRAVQEEARL